MSGPGAVFIGSDELAELATVIESRQLGRYGPESRVHAFERQIQSLAPVHALAVSSGTAALFIALHALGIEPGDEVIVPGFTYVATMSAVSFAGGTPVLVEIDDTFCLDPQDVARRITPRTKAIIIVHMLGYPARMDELLAVAGDIPVIEDTAQAFGGTYGGRKLGSMGTIGTYSFNEHKTISCGDGGMLVTKDPALYERAFALHDQGHIPYRSSSKMVPNPLLGLNFRMTELQGAVLLAQLRRLPAILGRLRAHRDVVAGYLHDLPLTFRPYSDGDINTHLVLTFEDAPAAQRVAKALDSITLDASGWHVYSNMGHLGLPKSSLPQTDALLARSMSFGIGVIDANLAPVGLDMHDTAKVVMEKARRLRRVIEEAL